MRIHLIAAVVVCMMPSHAGAGPIDLKQDLGGLDVTVTMSPRDNPEALRIDNRSQQTISCSANFTGLDQNRTVKVTAAPGKSATIRIPRNRGGTPRSAELRCR
jgi:hypothetical protein